MLKVGSKFDTFDELSQRLEEFQKIERVQLWVRDSRTVTAAAKRARRKSLNPALKYAELTYSCVFGGRRPSDQTKIHNQTSAGGCPFKVRLSTSGDGQALVVKEICHNHNHEPGKKLHDEPRRLYKKTHQSRATSELHEEGGSCSDLPHLHSLGATVNTVTSKQPIKLIVSKHSLNTSASSPFTNLQQLQQQQSHSHHLHQQQHGVQQQHHTQPLKLELHSSLLQQHFIKEEQPNVDIGPTPLPTPDHLYSMDYNQTSFSFNTPSNTNTPNSSCSSPNSTPNSSNPNTPQNSPNTSPTNSLSSGLEEPVLNFNMPPSPISPSTQPTLGPHDTDDDVLRLEPLYELTQVLEDGLANLPSVDSDDLPLISSCVKGGSVSSTAEPRSRHTATTSLPLVRTLAPVGAGHKAVRVAYTANITSAVHKTNKLVTGGTCFNSDSGLLKSVKAATVGSQSGGGGGGSLAMGVHYNFVSSKQGGVAVAASCGRQASVPGAGVNNITIKQFLSNPVEASSVFHSGTVTHTKATTSIAASPAIVGGIGASSNNNIGIPITTIGCSLMNGAISCGPVKNYRAKIAKKPYGVGSIFRVVRSDNISGAVDTIDRLINTVTPNKVNIVEVSSKLPRSSGTMDHDLPAEEQDLFSDSVHCSSIDSGCNVYEMDKVISGGGLDADIKIKTELVEGATDLCASSFQQSLVSCSSLNRSDGVIGGHFKDEPSIDTGYLGMEEENLFVLDGLEPSLGGDIPMTPETLFNVADLDKYDFMMF